MINCITTAPKENPTKTEAVNVAVVDDFTNRTIELVINSGKLAHGELVEGFIKSELPNSKFDRYDVTVPDSIDTKFITAGLPKDYDKPYYKFTKPQIQEFRLIKFESQLNQLNTNIANGKNYSAVNMSTSISLDLNHVSKALGKTITEENIHQYKDEVKKFLADEKSGKIHNLMSNIITQIERITESKTPVYIAAGNKSEAYFNALSLANGVNVVGATDETGNMASYTLSNPFINKKENGTGLISAKVITKYEDGSADLGVDYTGDKKIDLVFKVPAGQKNVQVIEKIQGTSYATPRSLAKDIKK